MSSSVVRAPSRRLATAAVLALAAACAGPEPQPSLATMMPPPDPRAELERHHDEFWAYLVTTYDQDRDARVTRAEYARGDDSFANLDRDGDAALTRGDFSRDLVAPPGLVAPIVLIRIAGGPEAKSAGLDAIRDALLAMDEGGDGRVARAEFQRAASKGMLGIDRFGTLLAGMDQDGDELLSAPEIDRWLAGRDVDGDGALVLRERDRPGPPPPTGFLAAETREPAPDFVASSLAEREPVTLRSLVRGKPLVLIFGSFT